MEGVGNLPKRSIDLIGYEGDFVIVCTGMFNVYIYKIAIIQSIRVCKYLRMQVHKFLNM